MAVRGSNGRTKNGATESPAHAWLAKHRRPVAYAAVVASTLFSAALVYAYREGERANTAEPPLVRASKEPLRVKPDDPGGMTVPDRDKLVYNRVSGEGEEVTVRLRPGPELPVERPPPAPEAEAKPEVKPEVRPEPVKEQAATAPLPSPPAPVADGVYVQLGALSSEGAAAVAWDRLRQRFPDLASLTRSVLPLRRNDGVTLYRLRAGPVADKAAADKLCATLKAGGQGCFLASP